MLVPYQSNPCTDNKNLGHVKRQVWNENHLAEFESHRCDLPTKRSQVVAILHSPPKIEQITILNGGVKQAQDFQSERGQIQHLMVNNARVSSDDQ